MKVVLQESKRKVIDLYGKYHKIVPVASFLAGFLFDLITFRRIDNWFSIIKQGAYLLIIATLLVLDVQQNNRGVRVPNWFSKVWTYREFAVHFLLGSLLSLYVIFYFKSSSFFTSFYFVGGLSIIFVANELPRFQKFGMPIRFGLYFLCLSSYFIYLVPVILGFLGPIAFLISMLAAGSVFFLICFTIAKQNPNFAKQFLKLQLPGISVAALLVGLYFIKILPPMPLSIEYLGIYHDIKKIGGHYELYHERPFWKFWQHGDQLFLSRPEDKIYCFARIFSPTAFKDKVKIRWMYLERNGKWTTWDAIPFEIKGGRSEGYRGYTFKNNYQPGRWRVQIETEDEREIGRIYFTVEPDSEYGTRDFDTDLQ